MGLLPVVSKSSVTYLHLHQLGHIILTAGQHRVIIYSVVRAKEKKMSFRTLPKKSYNFIFIESNLSNQLIKKIKLILTPHDKKKFIVQHCYSKLHNEFMYL